MSGLAYNFQLFVVLSASLLAPFGIEYLIMMLRGYNLFELALFATCIFLLVLTIAPQAGADSFASLNMFGFPATGNSLSGLSGLIMNNDMLSASSASYSPSNQFSGYFGSGLSGIQMGVNFAYPLASHDASTATYGRNVAWEATLGDDSISFPEINVDVGSSLTSFPTIKSSNADIKYMESVQFQLSTESDTMPIAGFSFPGFFGSGFL
jgi:hypothetical protein